MPIEESDSGQPSINRGARLVELAQIFVLLAIVVALLVLATGTARLIVHPFWLDECLTSLLVNDSSFGHAMHALSRGVNHSPPGLYVLMWTLRTLGYVGPTSMRLFSSVLTILAATGVYAICREFAGRAASLLAALALLVHPLMIEQIFEARFYTLWLAATAWFFAASLHDRRRRSNGWLAIAVMSSILACASYWFAVLVIAIAGGFDFFLNRSSSPRDQLRRLLPVFCGIATTLLLSPMALRQRSVAVIPTWIAPISLGNVRDVLGQLFLVVPVVAAVIAWWIAAPSPTRSVDPRALAPMNSMLLLPLLLIVLSFTLQPLLLPRYAIVVLIPLSAMCAGLTAQFRGRRGAVALAALFVTFLLSGASALRARVDYTDAMDGQIRTAIDDVDTLIAHRASLPVVFLRRWDLYPLLELRSDLSASAALIELDADTLGRAPVDMKFEQQMAHVDSAEYPNHRLIPYQQLRDGGLFYVVAPPLAGIDLPIIFPGAEIHPVSRGLFSVEFARK